MVTPEANAGNLKTAARNVAARLGITDTRNMTHEIRIAYNKELTAEILRYPQSFTAETLAVAKDISDNDHRLADPSFSFGEFGSAVLDNATVVIPAFGKSVLTAAVIVACVYIVSENWDQISKSFPRTA